MILLSMGLFAAGLVPAGAPLPLRAVMFRGGPAHTGAYTEPLQRNLAGVQWRFDTRGSVVSSPAVMGDTVWVGSTDGVLYALDRVSGRLRWKVDLGSPISSSPAVMRGIVVVGTRDGRYHALRSASGSPIWRFVTGADLPWHWGHESGDHWTASPTIAGDVVVVGAGDGSVSALDLATGRARWRAMTAGRVRSSPAVAGGRVFVGSADGNAYAFDLKTGAIVWRFATLGATLESGQFGYDRRTIQSSPAVAGGVVYLGGRDGFLYALSAMDGSLKWKFDYRISWVNGSPSVADGVVYAGTSDGHFVNALDAATGVELWRTGSNGAIVWSSTAVVGEVAIVGDGSGRIRAYDRKTGAIKWAFATGAQVFSSPVPSGSLVIVGSNDGGVYALRTAPAGVDREVFVDTASAIKADPPEAAAAGYFATRGYLTLGAADLARWLEARTSDRAPSVVVFAMDNLPPEAVTEPLERSLLRRYLDAGGKVVWLRPPPMIALRDPVTGERPKDSRAFRWEAAGRLLGLKTAGIFDQRSVTPTGAGERWGLTGRWREAWGVPPEEVSEVLALDDWRLAASWVKSYGGPAGTGFVRAPGDENRSAYLLAEYRPALNP